MTISSKLLIRPTRYLVGRKTSWVVQNYRILIQDGGQSPSWIFHKTQYSAVVWGTLMKIKQLKTENGHMTKNDTGSKIKMAAAVITRSLLHVLAQNLTWRLKLMSRKQFYFHISVLKNPRWRLRHFKFLFNGYNSVANSLLRAIVEIKIIGILLKLSSHCYSSSDS